MFENKKDNEQNDDLQTATRSMKSDMENTSPEDIEDSSDNPSQPQTQPLQEKTESGMDKLKEQMKKADEQDVPMSPSSSKKESLSSFSGSPSKTSGKNDPEKQPEEIESKQKGTSLSAFFSILLIIVLLAAAGAGAYYYFFIINNQPQPAPSEEPADSEEDPPVDPIVPENDLPDALSSANVLELQEGAGIESILVGSTNGERVLEKGFYIILKEGQQAPLEINQAQSDLGFQLPGESVNAVNNFWLYHKPSSDKDARSLVGLLFEIDTEKTNEVRQSCLENEPSLPQMFSGLYPEISASDPRFENVEFSSSQDNKGFRYYNLNPDEQSVSLDWSLVETENNTFLVIATSKNMASEMALKIKQ